ncbi:hypothetical protein D3C78_1163400 [compost metagenome]
MSLMQESMKNPLFKVEILDLMKTAVQEELQPKSEEKGGKKKEEKSSGDGGSDKEEGKSDEQGDSSM